MTESVAKAERWLEHNSGWGRFFLTIVFLVAQGAYITKDLQDRAQASANEAREFRVQLGILQSSIASLSTEINRLAVSNEALKQVENTNTERIRRLEQIDDRARQ